MLARSRGWRGFFHGATPFFACRTRGFDSLRIIVAGYIPDGEREQADRPWRLGGGILFPIPARGAMAGDDGAWTAISDAARIHTGN